MKALLRRIVASVHFGSVMRLNRTFGETTQKFRLRAIHSSDLSEAPMYTIRSPGHFYSLALFIRRTASARSPPLAAAPAPASYGRNVPAFVPVLLPAPALSPASPASLSSAR